METLQIVKADEKDIPFIRDIALAAWPVAYSPILSAGQIEYMLATLYRPAELQRQIHSDIQFLLAYHQKNPIGFAGFGPYIRDYKLYKLYVRPDVQKTGAGKMLLRESEKRCRAAGAERIILNVHRSNPARSFYEKLGFKIYETIDIPFGPGFMLNDYLMEKNLLTPGVPAVAGGAQNSLQNKQ